MSVLGLNPAAPVVRQGLPASPAISFGLRAHPALQRDTVQFRGALPADSSYGHLPYPVAKDEDLEKIYPELHYQLHKDAAKAFREMAVAAAKDGITIKPISGFRSYERQVELFHGEARKRGITLEERAKLCAPPGFSEHHTGYIVDLKDDTPGAALEEIFETTPAFAWMQQNAHQFGWELSFPRGNRQGVMYEPWHWRWVGNATTQALFARARKLNA